jgi:hypothetical protein
LALPQKETKNSSPLLSNKSCKTLKIYQLYNFVRSFDMPPRRLGYLNLSARESQNFRPSRKAMIVAHFGFPPSAGPESGQGSRAFHIANFF